MRSSSPSLQTVQRKARCCPRTPASKTFTKMIRAQRHDADHKEMRSHVDDKDAWTKSTINGCKNLRVIDACWKLCIPHCMIAVSTKVDGYPLLNFSNVCVDEPKPGSVFCEAHHTLLERHRIPTEKKAFLKHIGCKPTPKSQTDIKHVDQKVLSFMDTLTKTDPSSTLVGTSATSYQGYTDEKEEEAE